MEERWSSETSLCAVGPPAPLEIGWAVQSGRGRVHSSEFVVQPGGT